MGDHPHTQDLHTHHVPTLTLSWLSGTSPLPPDDSSLHVISTLQLPTCNTSKLQYWSFEWAPPPPFVFFQPLPSPLGWGRSYEALQGSPSLYQQSEGRCHPPHLHTHTHKVIEVSTQWGLTDVHWVDLKLIKIVKHCHVVFVLLTVQLESPCEACTHNTW